MPDDHMSHLSRPLRQRGPTFDDRDGWHTPKAMDEADAERVQEDFRAAAARSRQAGFEVVGSHGAQGYLLHSFLSPISNQHTDGDDGDREGRISILGTPGIGTTGAGRR